MRYVVYGLGICFFSSMVLIRVAENFVTENLYLISSVWMGLMWNAFLAIFIVLIIKAFIPSLSLIYLRNISVFLISLSLVYSVVGIYWAMYPLVKNVDVSISNLPENWRDKKIIQLSDVHLGVIYDAGHFSKTVETVNDLNPDLILITGDLFDGMDGSMDTFLKPLSELKAKNGVYMITGNHEVYLGEKQTLDIVRRAGIRILDNEIINIDNLQLGGISYDLSQSERGKTGYVAGIIKDWQGFDSSKASVVMYHVPSSIDEFSAAGVSLLLSGHTHRGQQFPFSFLTKLIFKGFDYGLNYSGNLAVYTSSGVGSWGPPLKNNQRSEIVVLKLK